MNARFEYRCIKATHQVAAPASATTNPITVHDEHWAYCPAGTAGGHEWKGIAPSRLEDLALVQGARRQPLMPHARLRTA